MGIGRWAAVLLGLASAFARGANDEKHLAELAPWIASCVGRADNPEYPVFHGCWDWHSAAHGHWALLRIARATRFSAGAEQVEKSLSLDGIRGEEERLTAEPSFENPYGRAWFLRLAMEFERWADQNQVKDAARLRRLGGLVSASLLSHFEAVPVTPESREYDNASWAFFQLHSWFRFVKDREKLGEVEAIIADRFVGSEAKVHFGLFPSDFFSVFGNWAYLVAKTTSGETFREFLAERPIADEHLAPVEKTTDHSLGLNWSRAWALKAMARRLDDPAEKRRFARAYQAHVRVGMRNHYQYREDYKAYGHWVPQFAVYALTEGTPAGEDDF